MLLLFLFALSLPLITKAFFLKNKSESLSYLSPEKKPESLAVLDPALLQYKKTLSSRGGEVLKVSDSFIEGVNTTSLGIQSQKEDLSDKKSLRYYIVQKGDTLSEIAENFGVSVDTIVWENNIKGGLIKVGQKLSILPTSGLRYKVKKGDTLSKIAKKYKITEESIKEFNSLEGEKLKVSSYLILPKAKKQKSFAKYYPKAKSYVSKTNTYFIHPLPGAIRTQGLHGRKRNAVDLAAKWGTPIRAAASGVVEREISGGWGWGYGTHLIIRHPNGVRTLYAHNSKNLVKKGDWVVKGQIIAKVGSTGNSTGPHLHFEVRGGRNPF